MDLEALCKACEDGAKYIVEKIVSGAEFDINEQDSKGRPPLLYAVINHNVKVLDCLLNDYEDKSRMDVVDSTVPGDTVLHWAVQDDWVPEKDCAACLKVLVDVSWNKYEEMPNKINDEGNTPIGQAVNQGNFEAVRILAGLSDLYIDLDVKNTEGDSLIEMAFKRKNEAGITEDHKCKLDKIIEFLTQIPAITSFCEACRWGNNEEVKDILAKEEVDINASDRDFRPPLINAVIGQSPSTVELLLANEKIKLDVFDGRLNGPSAIHTASMTSTDDSIECLKLLVSDTRCTTSILNQVNLEKETAICTAVSNRNLNAVKILAEQPGIDLSCRNRNGLSLLELAGYWAGMSYEWMKESEKTAAQDILNYLEELPDCKAQKDIIAFGKACWYGDDEKVQEMKERGDIDVNELYKGKPFLYLAVQGNHSSVVALLLSDEKTRLDVRVLDEQSHETVLHVAAAGDSKLQLLKLLLQDSRCTPQILNSRDKNGETPIFRAADKYGCLDCVDILRAQPNIELNVINNDGKSKIFKKKQKKVTGDIMDIEALCKACKEGDDNKIIAIVKRGECDINKINEADSNGRPPLFHALINNKFKAIAALLYFDDARLDVVDSTVPGDSLLHWAVSDEWVPWEDCRNCLRILVEDGRSEEILNKVNDEGNTAIGKAVFYGNFEALKILAAHRYVDLGVKNNEGDSLIDVAIKRRNEAGLEEKQNKIINFLTQIPAITALCEACNEGNNEKVEDILTNEEVDINAAEPQGSTPLICAVCRKHPRTLELLLSKEDTKLDVFHTGFNNWSALHWACWGNDEVQTECLRLLVTDSRCTTGLLNHMNTRQCTALYHAIFMHNFDAVKLLVEQPGIDVSGYDQEGLSLLDVADNQAKESWRYNQSTESWYLESTVAVDMLKYLKELPLFKAQKLSIEFGKACNTGDAEKVQELMKKGDIDVNGMYKGIPFISGALNQSQLNIVALLLSEEKTRLHNDNDFRNEGKTALHRAISDMKCLKLLLNDSRCTPSVLNARDAYGETPLFEAVTSEYHDAVELLMLQPEIDLDGTNKYGKTLQELLQIMEENYIICN